MNEPQPTSREEIAPDPATLENIARSADFINAVLADHDIMCLEAKLLPGRIRALRSDRRETMNQRELEVYMVEMWCKYSTYERSGVLMRETAFHSAIREVLQHMKVDVAQAERPEVDW